MKFRKGDSVEVLRREHDPCGSWFTGIILLADGDNYIVRFNLVLDREGKQVVEKVQGKDVRPLPPPPPPSLNGKRWAVGDIAEVFDIRCWRVGKVAKVLKNNNRFVIKFFGSIQLKEFHASCLRIRQTWHGMWNKWIVIGKVAQDKDLNNNLTPKTPYRTRGLLFRTSLHMRKTLQSRENDREGQHEGGSDNVTMCLSMRAISKGYARQSEQCDVNPFHGGTIKRRKLLSRSRGCDETIKRTLPLFNQVDHISCSHAVVGEKFIKQSTNNNNSMRVTTPHSIYDSSRPVWSTEDSDQCSVASCSFNGFVASYAGRISHKSLRNTPDDSDAESSFPSLCGKRDLLLSPVDKVVDIHELELRAYKSTVEALHASGPLTWEQESLLTNLRLSLNISDEEHLLQLRHMLSTQVT